MNIPAIANRETLEFAKFLNMVIFTQAKCEPYTHILQAHKFIKLDFSKVKVLNVETLSICGKSNILKLKQIWFYLVKNYVIDEANRPTKRFDYLLTSSDLPYLI